MLFGPFLVLLVVVFVVPTAYSLYLSFFSQSHSVLGFGNGVTSFAGLRNYAVVLSDPSFLSGTGITLLYAVLFIAAVIVGALVLALLFDSGAVRMRRFMQTVLFVPHAVPGIIGGVIWLYLYTPGISPVVKALDKASITVNFRGLDLVMPSLVNIALW
ncbi:hypothetical protein GCM10022222_32720 [Amycolatopsis ultiminotia]|uniref:ABC transmembrane type-1 domain-containing protein n=1 Tax=Amycolatopsis ultiminotia TaxID=543629 RepID=A0ABP6W615_9PSEU